MSNLLSAKNLTKIYGQEPNQTIALDGVSINIKKGEFVAIVGPSGSGKSTLMHILGCLDKPTNGQYIFGGKEVSQLSDSELAKIRNEEIGFVFQFFNLLPRTSALKNAELPLVYSNTPKNKRTAIATKLLEKVGLGDKLNSTGAELSGGQQQRVAIARALVNDPSVIFADEPTGNLDSKSSAQIMEIFKKLNREDRTIVIITHERDIALNAKRIITTHDGKIISDKKVR
ncbi:MAG: ABC transporter ATP-binding protein [Patescibacteria group bacterium]